VAANVIVGAPPQPPTQKNALAGAQPLHQGFFQFQAVRQPAIGYPGQGVPIGKPFGMILNLCAMPQLPLGAFPDQ